MKKHLTLSDILLIAINLIPVWGVWFRGWDPKQMFVVYCCETIIIGLINVFKMGIISFTNQPNIDITDKNTPKGFGGKLFLILFFMFHYGFFIIVQLTIFLGVSGFAKTGTSLNIITKIPALLQPEAKLMLLIFTAGYAIKEVLEFVFTGAYKTASIMTVMFEPYVRIFIQQFVVIIGSIFLLFNLGKIFVLVYAAFIIFFGLMDYKGLLRLAELKEKRKQRQEKKNIEMDNTQID